MFRTMRRFKQELPEAEARAVLERGTSGVLAVSGDDGYPYTVPLSYVYADGKIYFHSAKNGHKIDAIKACNKVSFCVVDEDRVVPEEYTTYYRSVVAFGRANILEDEDAQKAALAILAAKYAPEQVEGRTKEVEKGFAAVHLVEVEIEHLTGKEHLKLMQKKEAN